jgi:hypothetical protein
MSHLDEVAGGHRRAWELIPWIVNGRASAPERQLVDEHVRACGDCREELELQRRLRAAMAQEHAVEHDPRPALDRLWARIDADDDAAQEQLPRPAVAQRMLSATFVRWLAAAVVVEAVGLTALGANVWMRAGPAALNQTFHTLSAPQAASPGATIRAVFAPQLAAGELQGLLDAEQLQIVAGPTEAGVYSLAPRATPDQAATQVVLEHLRAHPGVRFAESIAIAAPPQ